MEENIKLCPNCSAEFYAHIEECRTCGVALVTPEELERHRAARTGDGPLVCIEEGELDKVTGLSHALAGLGFETQVLKAPGGGCSGGFGIFVAQSVAQEAAGHIQELWHRLYPEIKEAEARLESGLCPACGSKFSYSDAECPDCGLFLGGDNTGGYGNCGPSNCGPGCP